MKKKLPLVLAAVPVALLGVLYGGGYIGQFISNYKTWSASGGFAGDGTAPVFPSASITACFRSALSFPYGLIGIFICVLLLLFAFVMKLGFAEGGEYDRDRKLMISGKGTYGTAGFMSRREAESLLEIGDIRDCTGLILGELDGKVVALPNDTYFNKNLALQLIKLGQSFICTDPKSELTEDLLEYAKSQGYTCRILNLVHPEASDAWNCLGEVEGNELMAQVFSDVIIKNTGSDRGDPFWDNGELNLLKALVLYVDQGPDGTDKSLAEVTRLLTLKDETALNKIFDLLPITHPAKAPYSIFKQASETVRTGIIIGLGTRLQLLQNSQIQDITSHNEIDLTLPGREKCAYFVVTSDQDSTCDFISSLFFSFLFIKLVRYADQYGEDGRLPIPVTIIGDEWPNIGTVPDLPKKISTIRSRALSLVCCFQNLPQLQNRYPFNAWQEILGNCDTTVFMGCTDPLTAQFVSDRTGEASIAVSSQSKMLGTWRISSYTPEYRETDSIGKRKLLTMDEIMRFPMDQTLVFLRGQKVLKLKKFDYSRHPDAKKLVKRKAAQHIPEWRVEQEKASPGKDASRPSVDPSVQAAEPPAKKTRPVRQPKPKLPKVDPDTGEVIQEQQDSKVTRIQKEDILS